MQHNKHFRIVFLFFCLCLLAGGLSGCGSSNGGILAVDPASNRNTPTPWRLVWSDEFEGTTLDLTKWEYRMLGVRRGGYNTQEAVSVQDGLLTITTIYNTTRNRFETGMIGTQPTFQQRYGYYEARIKLLNKPGHWQAFWLQSPRIHDAVEPPNPAEKGAEIDIMEYKAKDPNIVNFTVHWNGYGSGHRVVGVGRNPGVAPGEWHTFGLLWTPTGYTFYVDSRPVHSLSTGVSQIAQYLILSSEVPDPGTVSWAGLPNRENFPDAMQVDYVRVYETTDGQYPVNLASPGT